MTVEQAVQTALAASGALTALIPAARIRIAGDHVQLDDPYLIHGPSRERSQAYLGGGYASLRGFDYSVSVFARALSLANQAAEAARSALASIGSGAIAIIEGSTRSYEPETRLYQITIEARVWLAP